MAPAWSCHTLAGAASGVAVVLVGQPFDTVKVRQQVFGYVSPLDALRECVRREGLAGLYKGTSPQLPGAALQHAVRMGSYSAAKAWWQLDSGALVGALAGASTGLCVSVIATPVERLKCLQQVERGRRIPLTELLREAVRHGSLPHLFTGFVPTVCRSVLGNVAAFACYESCCVHDVPVAVAGGLAGGAFWTACLPADAVKSHMQAAPLAQQHASKVAPCAQQPDAARLRPGARHVAAPLSCWATARHIVQHAGVFAFWRGYSVVLLRALPVNVAPLSAICYVCVCMCAWMYACMHVCVCVCVCFMCVCVCVCVCE